MTHSALLSAPERKAGDNFGFALAASGELAVVGAPRTVTDAGEGAGAVYWFDGWKRTGVSSQRLLPQAGQREEGFGYALALQGNTLVVGAPHLYTRKGPAPGAVYVFEYGGSKWQERARLTPPRPTVAFGAAVALSGDTLLVGAPPAAGGLGAAYVFVRKDGGFALQQELSPPKDGLGFGAAVALLEDRALIAAPGSQVQAVKYAGAAYLYSRRAGRYNLISKLSASKPVERAQVGKKIALTGSAAFLGAPQEKPSGFVHVFDLAKLREHQVVGALPALPQQVISATGTAQTGFGSELSLGSRPLVASHVGNSYALQISCLSHVHGKWEASSPLDLATLRPSSASSRDTALDPTWFFELGPSLVELDGVLLVGLPSAEKQAGLVARIELR